MTCNKCIYLFYYLIYIFLNVNIALSVIPWQSFSETGEIKPVNVSLSLKNQNTGTEKWQTDFWQCWWQDWIKNYIWIQLWTMLLALSFLSRALFFEVYLGLDLPCLTKVWLVSRRISQPSTIMRSMARFFLMFSVSLTSSCMILKISIKLSHSYHNITMMNVVQIMILFKWQQSTVHLKTVGLIILTYTDKLLSKNALHFIKPFLLLYVWRIHFFFYKVDKTWKCSSFTEFLKKAN